MSNSHKYKIGQKVKYLKDDKDYFIVGIKSYVFPCNGTNLILHKNGSAPTRRGFYASPSHVEVLK